MNILKVPPLEFHRRLVKLIFEAMTDDRWPSSCDIDEDIEKFLKENIETVEARPAYYSSTNGL